MKPLAWIAVAALLASCAVAETVNFDNTPVAQVPEGWLAGLTGNGTPKWSVKPDSSAPTKPHVLKQSGKGTYPWCIKKGVSLTNGFVEVKFKPISGKEDQAGGVVWRWKDGDNYYIARANALEDNVAIYHTIQGTRQSFQSVDVKVAKNQWHTLRVDLKGKHFVVTFDSKAVLEADDESIAGAGTIGVWTKADSVTSFDDFIFGGD